MEGSWGIERKEVGDQSPAIQEENENDTGRCYRERGNGGNHSSNPAQQETNGENLGNVELGGG